MLALFVVVILALRGWGMRQRQRFHAALAEGGEADPGRGAARPRLRLGPDVIPPAVWSSAELLFVGLEVYLPSQGMGCPADWRFAAGLILDH